METAELTRPPKPRAPGAPQDTRPMITPRPGPVLLQRGMIVQTYDDDAPAKPAEAAPPPQPPAPMPKREPRRDGPPSENEKQLHVLGSGMFSLPDGTTARAGDYINLPSELADEWLKRGVANPVEVPAEIPPVTGDMKGEISASELLGAAR
jgi:hypothetical protein